jgi:manganese/zinc/iron transport system permease protein
LAWSELGRGAGWSAWQRAVLPRWLRADGLVAEGGGGTAALTPAGAALARDLARRHRLWEHYLQSAGGVRPGATHRSAAAVEHTLPPEVAREAEAWLRAHDPGRLPPAGAPLPPPGEAAEERRR